MRQQLWREGNHGRIRGPYVRRRVRAQRRQPPSGFSQEVAHHAVDGQARHLVDQAGGFKLRMLRLDPAQRLARQWQLAQLVEADESGADTVIKIVVVVSDVVRQRRYLRI